MDFQKNWFNLTTRKWFLNPDEFFLVKLRETETYSKLFNEKWKENKKCFLQHSSYFLYSSCCSNVQIRIKDSLWLVMELFVISFFLMLFSIKLSSIQVATTRLIIVLRSGSSFDVALFHKLPIWFRSLIPTYIKWNNPVEEDNEMVVMPTKTKQFFRILPVTVTILFFYIWRLFFFLEAITI